jgi:hypothetical protein
MTPATAYFNPLISVVIDADGNVVEAHLDWTNSWNMLQETETLAESYDGADPRAMAASTFLDALIDARRITTGRFYSKEAPQ